MFRKLFGNRKQEIDLDSIGLNLNEAGKESLQKFASRKRDERMMDVMYLGDQGNINFFYIMYYAILFDPDLDVKFAGLKRIHKFQEDPNFELLLTKLEEPGVGEKMEPYYSMMLAGIGKISEEEFNKRISQS